MVQVVLQPGVPVELYTATGVTPSTALSISNTSTVPLMISPSEDMADFQKIQGRDASVTLSGLSEVWVRASFATTIEVTSEIVLTDTVTSLGGQVVTAQTTVEQGIEDGCVFYMYDEQSIGSGASYDYLLRTGANTIRAKARVLRTNSPDGTYFVYRAPTTSADGTEIDLQNFNEVDPKTTTAQIFGAPTVTDPGTEIDGLAGYGSTGFLSSGGFVDEGSSGERILLPNTDYLIRITNRDTGTDDFYYRLVLCDKEAT